jgi:hypothetical protein
MTCTIYFIAVLKKAEIAIFMDGKGSRYGYCFRR